MSFGAAKGQTWGRQPSSRFIVEGWLGWLQHLVDAGVTACRGDGVNAGKPQLGGAGAQYPMRARANWFSRARTVGQALLCLTLCNAPRFVGKSESELNLPRLNR